MKQILLIALVNTVFIQNVSSLKPNIFWKHTRTMTRNFGGNLYKRTKTAITPIVAKLKNTNGGFYEPKTLYKSNSNEFTGYYNDYLESRNKYSTPKQDPIGNGLYQDYRRSLVETQYYAFEPVPSLVAITSPLFADDKHNSQGLYEEYRKSLKVNDTHIHIDKVNYSSLIDIKFTSSGFYQGGSKSKKVDSIPYDPPVSCFSPIKSITNNYGFYQGGSKSKKVDSIPYDPPVSCFSPIKSITNNYGFYQGGSKSKKVDSIPYDPPVSCFSPIKSITNNYGFYQG